MTKQVMVLATACAVLVLAAIGGTASIAARTAGSGNFVVLFKSESVPANAATMIQQAGGSLVYAYNEIGVAIANSADPAFQTKLATNKSVESAASTAGFATRLEDDQVGDSAVSTEALAPATDSDSLSGLQWDMKQIKAPEAHAISGGSSNILVGDIDTGIDFSHPDLQPNIDVADSVNCVSGAPQPGTAAQDDNGHGTHTAGTIAAASNGVGIVGVAPNVRIAAIKSGDANGFFFPEAVVCGFYWAGQHHMDVTNNSYFADPWEYNCKNDPTQRAIWKAEQRAIRYAQKNGVVVIASIGNDSDDVAHPTRDITSPDDTTPQERQINNDCIIIPVEIEKVIGVSATGNFRQTDNDNDANDYLKSFYSSFGKHVAEVTAPGGDSRYFTSEAAPNGRVLSDWPASLAGACLRQVTDPAYPGVLWCYQQGTSMASPHVVGVAALILSQLGTHIPKGEGKSDKVRDLLQHTADAQPCPTALPPGYDAVLGVNSGLPQHCEGGKDDNSWYGKGQVNALRAVTNDHN